MRTARFEKKGTSRFPSTYFSRIASSLRGQDESDRHSADLDPVEGQRHVALGVKILFRRVSGDPPGRLRECVNLDLPGDQIDDPLDRDARPRVVRERVGTVVDERTLGDLDLKPKVFELGDGPATVIILGAAPDDTEIGKWGGLGVG